MAGILSDGTGAFKRFRLTAPWMVFRILSGWRVDNPLRKSQIRCLVEEHCGRMRAFFGRFHQPPRQEDRIMKAKFYTVMIIPHTRARFSRLRVSATFVLILSFIALASVISTGLLPVYVQVSKARAAEIRNLKQENRQLRAAGQEVDQSLAALRDRVSFFETKATKFAMMAGVQDLPSAQPAGGI